MQRRTKLALIVLVGILLLFLGLYLLLSPYLAERAAQQPPPVGNKTPLITGNGAPYQPQGGTAATGTGQNVPLNTQLALEISARNVVERVGSGSSETGFLGYLDAMGSLTPGGQATLQADRAVMRQTHPPTAALYQMLTRGVASHATKGKLGDEKIEVTVEAIQDITTGLGAAPSSTGKKILVTFVKQSDGVYLVDSMSWSDIRL